MSVQDTSKGILTTALSVKAGVTVPASSLNAAIPKQPSAEESTRNSKTKVYPADTATYAGSQVIFYDRLNLADLSNFTFVVQRTSAEGQLYDILNVVRDQTGIRFTQDDLEPAEVEEAEDGTLSILLKAKPSSIAWTGEYRMSLLPYPHISTAFTGNVLNGF